MEKTGTKPQQFVRPEKMTAKMKIKKGNCFLFYYYYFLSNGWPPFFSLSLSLSPKLTNTQVSRLECQKEFLILLYSLDDFFFWLVKILPSSSILTAFAFVSVPSQTRVSTSLLTRCFWTDSRSSEQHTTHSTSTKAADTQFPPSYHFNVLSTSSRYNINTFLFFPSSPSFFPSFDFI